VGETAKPRTSQNRRENIKKRGAKVKEFLELFAVNVHMSLPPAEETHDSPKLFYPAQEVGYDG
jgi:hypothetical protein